MKAKRFWFFIIFIFLVIFLSGNCKTGNSGGEEPGPGPGNETPDFVRRSGRQLVTGTDGNVVHLRGVNFNNFHWESEAATIFNVPHHSETDYQRIADMGMNTVRFNLSYVIFEEGASADGTNDNEAAWEWIDRNVSWAKTHGIYLILDMHVPPGGYQGGTAEGTELWTDPQNRERFKTL
ncbi:MAG: cellulase family glycosylhydrolase, partial [bacterium]|nr:cellulase family glycosylhydrolase [bacterium]